MNNKERTVLCPFCDGSGEGIVDSTKCFYCKGIGVITLVEEGKEDADG